MTAATANRKFKSLANTVEIASNQLLNKNPLLNADKVYVGTMAAVDYTGEIQNAADTVGLRVLGMFDEALDNTNDGLSTLVKRGVVLYVNSSTSPLTAAKIGEPCYVEDNQTVAGKTTNFIVAGLVYDVTSEGVWVDQRCDALAIARRNGIRVMVAKTDDFAITSAQAFTGNIIFTGDKAGGMTFTLPSAVPAMRVGIQRASATSGRSVSIQAATGDKILGSAAGKKVDYSTNGVSGILNIVAADATDWVAAWFPADYALWTINNA